MAKATKLPSGNWRVRIKDNDDTMSPWKSFTADTPEEAEFLAAQYKFKKIQDAKPEKRTVGRCMDEYIDGRTNVLSPSTIALYRVIRKSAFKTIEGIPLGKLTQANIQESINIYSKDHAYKTVKNAEVFLHVVINEYSPKFEYRVNMPQQHKATIIIPTTEQVNAVIAESKETPVYLPVLFGVLLGMRRSEVCALTWDDIDISKKIVTIRHAMVMDEFNAVVRKTTKTLNSNRTLHLPQQIIDALPEKPNKIITIPPKEVTRLFSKITKKLNYDFTFHGLRHYNASVMLKLNIPDKYAMERMGHSTNNMLKTVYQHTFIDESAEIANKVENFFDKNLE